jgi:hypothetical protein
VDVLEVRKLDAYLKGQFGNARIRVVPKKADAADVFVGEELIGTITVDDEDDDRSYNLGIKFLLGEPATIKNLKTPEASLRRKFDNEKIRVVARPRKTDSAEVYIAQEYIGVLYFDEKDPRACHVEMAILDLDLEDVRLS